MSGCVRRQHDIAAGNRVTVRLHRQRLVRELLGRAAPVDVPACRLDCARDAGQILPRMEARLILEHDARTAGERDVVDDRRRRIPAPRPAPLRREMPVASFFPGATHRIARP